MKTYSEFLAHSRAAYDALETLESSLEAAASLVVKTLQAGGRILVCGNGGSGAESAHFATELTGRYNGDRPSLPAVALNADGTLLTCIGNDYGWDSVFARQVEGLGQAGDLLVGLTTSGNSANVLAALETAKARGLHTLALLGKGGGKTKDIAEIEVLIPSDRTGPVQEAHLFAIHFICERVEEAFPPV